MFRAPHVGGIYLLLVELFDVEYYGDFEMWVTLEVTRGH